MNQIQTFASFSAIEEELVSNTSDNDVPRIHGTRTAHQQSQKSVCGEHSAFILCRILNAMISIWKATFIADTHLLQNRVFGSSDWVYHWSLVWLQGFLSSSSDTVIGLVICSH
jgi:hypothetical protein